MRSTFDLDEDGKMTMVEMKKKTMDMMAEMRVSSQRHSIYIRTVNPLGAIQKLPRQDEGEGVKNGNILST
jgi:hypothetical protein